MFTCDIKKSDISRYFDLFLKRFLFERGKFFVVLKASKHLEALALGFL